MLYHKRMTGPKARDYALNPVARAVAKAKLRRSILDAKVKIYLMADGEPCADFCEGVGMVLAVIGQAAEMDPKIGPHDSTVRVLRGGLSACQQMMLTNKWVASNAVAVEVALDAAMSLNDALSAERINRAWKLLTEGE